MTLETSLSFLEVTDESQLVKIVDLADGKMAYSPFMGFEKPDAIADLVQEHGGHELADAFAALRGEQGVPVSMAGPIIKGAVVNGLLMAPSVQLPDGEQESFAALPYSVDRTLLRERKPILDKALAVIACLKCGEYFGGATSLERAQLVRVVNKLLDPNRGSLPPHSFSSPAVRPSAQDGHDSLRPGPEAWRDLGGTRAH